MAMLTFHCSICNKIFESEDEYICLDDDTVVCLGHVHQPKELFLFNGEKLVPFVIPFGTVKSVARPWQEQLWLAPFEPCRNYHQ